MRTLHTLQHLSLMSLIVLISFSLITPVTASANEPAYGCGIVTDGDPGEWDLINDFFADMYGTGNSDNPVLSHLYLRYCCSTNILCALVLDVPNDGYTPDFIPSDAWIRIYHIGWSNDKLIDGNGNGNTTPRAFEWVYEIPGDETSPLLGFEACGQLDEGYYSEFEAHMDISGQTSSTGMESHGDAIPLTVFCEFLEIDTPQQFTLAQNYPNPFNPSTVIGYALTEPGAVQLAVYDTAGQLVTTLVNEVQAVGEYEVTFNVGSHPSGIYFYRILTSSGSDSRKMVFLK